jgi:hypothetical protein
MIEVAEHTEDKEKLYQKQPHGKKFIKRSRPSTPKSKHPVIDELN